MKLPSVYQPALRLVPASRRTYLSNHIQDWRWLYLFVLLTPVFGILNRPLPWGGHNLQIPLDDWLPIIPQLLPVYHSWFPLLLILSVVLFFRDLSLYRRLVRSLVIGQSLAYLTFLVFPTELTIRQPVVGTGFLSWLQRATYAVDAPYAGFPSVHVTLATLICFALWRTRSFSIGWRVALIAYECLIMATTVLLDQHVVLDIPGGWICAVLSWLLAGYFVSRREHAKKEEKKDE